MRYKTLIIIAALPLPTYTIANIAYVGIKCMACYRAASKIRQHRSRGRSRRLGAQCAASRGTDSLAAPIKKASAITDPVLLSGPSIIIILSLFGPRHGSTTIKYNTNIVVIYAKMQVTSKYRSTQVLLRIKSATRHTASEPSKRSYGGSQLAAPDHASARSQLAASEANLQSDRVPT